MADVPVQVIVAAFQDEDFPTGTCKIVSTDEPVVTASGDDVIEGPARRRRCLRV